MISLYSKDIYLIGDLDSFVGRRVTCGYIVLTREEFQRMVIKVPARTHEYSTQSFIQKKMHVAGVGNMLVNESTETYSVPPHVPLLVPKDMIMKLRGIENLLYTIAGQRYMPVTVDGRRYDCYIELRSYVSAPK